VRRFDLVAASPSLPDNHYDLILHSHVLEHVPCNIANVLLHLYRALKPNGLHVFCVPLAPGHYDEYLGPMSAEEATKRFGQSDHVRSFGVRNLDRHLGLLVNINPKPLLYDTFDKSTSDQRNIPESERAGLSGSTVFVTRKADFLLQPKFC
jgi:SAM-dependent methyltransferase